MGGRYGCCISFESERSQKSRGYRGDARVVFTLRVTLTFRFPSVFFFFLHNVARARPDGKYLMAVVNEYSAFASQILFCGLCFSSVTRFLSK